MKNKEPASSKPIQTLIQLVLSRE